MEGRSEKQKEVTRKLTALATESRENRKKENKEQKNENRRNRNYFIIPILAVTLIGISVAIWEYMKKEKTDDIEIYGEPPRKKPRSQSNLQNL